MADATKPAILQDSIFTVQEGFLYRASRTGAIWMNKLFFSSLVLLAVWLIIGAVQGYEGCADSRTITGEGNATIDQATPHCSVVLTPTAQYLGAMAMLSFLVSLGLGGIGLIVGKRILESTPAAQEVGAQREGNKDGPKQPPGN